MRYFHGFVKDAPKHEPHRDQVERQACVDGALRSFEARAQQNAGFGRLSHHECRSAMPFKFWVEARERAQSMRCSRQCFDRVRQGEFEGRAWFAGSIRESMLVNSPCHVLAKRPKWWSSGLKQTATRLVHLSFQSQGNICYCERCENELEGSTP